MFQLKIFFRDNNMNNKIDFITSNIDKLENTIDLINYIEFNKINYSKNSNGYFINLSLIEGKHIDFIYFTIKNNINFINTSEINITPFDSKKLKYISKDYDKIILSDLQKKMLNCI